jgi:1,4-alpha-glucan branching enzyme
MEQVALSQIVKTVSENGQESKKSSYGSLKVQVEFKLTACEAKSVAVAGSFNDWNAKKTPLRKVGDCWTASVELPRGRYEYRFVVDGNWVSDPNAKETAANPFGGSNSVLSL